MTATKMKKATEVNVLTMCRNCSSDRLAEVLDLGHQYLVGFVREKDESLPRAPLVLLRCGECGLLQLRHSVDSQVMWAGDYWYRSGVNATMRDALTDVVHSASRWSTEGTWLDIGANDGTLLSKVPSTFKRIGCEPSVSLHDLLAEHADVVVPKFFSAEAVDEPCSVITSCAMFYDLDNPGRFCADIHDTLADDGIWINQLNDAATMLEQNAWDGICHEHRTYWDLAQLARVYADNGLEMIFISRNHVNGGSVRIVARKAKAPAHKIPIPLIPSDDAVREFADRIRKWKTLMGWILDSWQMQKRKVYGYAASTKSGTLLQYLGRNEAIHAIADRNPLKHGTVQAGTWIPVCSEEQMREDKPDYLIGLAWAFKREFLAREQELLKGGTVFMFPLPAPEFVL